MSKKRDGRNWARWGVCVSVSVLLGLGLPMSSLAQEDLPEGFKQQGLPSPPPAEQIEAGKRVYFTKCVWCHGVTGAGDGPGAVRLWPRPRNFNAGTFKIRHTASGQLPLIDLDLLQTVTHGPAGLGHAVLGRHSHRTTTQGRVGLRDNPTGRGPVVAG